MNFKDSYYILFLSMPDVSLLLSLSAFLHCARSFLEISAVLFLGMETLSTLRGPKCLQNKFITTSIAYNMLLLNNNHICQKTLILIFFKNYQSNNKPVQFLLMSFQYRSQQRPNVINIFEQLLFITNILTYF